MSLKERWEEYRKEYLKFDDFEEGQEQEMQRTFYAGAKATLDEADSRIEYKSFGDALDAVETEINDFLAACAKTGKESA